ncbi:L-histidine N(alpha)-methyltransferase [Oceanicoccus sp. KOV_DT_Chl]|uniref:L-histidine N(alpha)-methyltransferase n=1 Tax=Oceanicoccus sp. KOV_DT_Chl TaxID=1904639 RepID=UPI000C7A443F|nr:L-histidine N(alpha)-methyltransferase [Oceanicoccus sp. KOV_DT_Chl]
MPATATATTNVYFEDQQPATTDSVAEVIAGLQLNQKRVDPKYFYDAHGSQLFEQITQLPEYYPTRTERQILSDNANDIAAHCGQGCVLIEPGSGSSEKIRLLLDTLRPSAYVPLDISAEFLYRSAVKLGREFPWLKIQAICADFADSWQTRTTLPEGQRVIFYPGSTIGNMDPAAAEKFLAGLRQWIGNDGGVLIGVDLHKEEHLLNAAYNDAQGVTAEFNLNILNSMNKLINSNFSDQQFSHRAFYNQTLQRIEMHLVSDHAQTVNVNGNAIAFDKGETLHTENSYKYTLESFTALSEAAGFTIKRSWLDDDALFSVHYLSVNPD